MTGGGACDLGRLTRPSTIASERTEIGEKMRIALTEAITRKCIRQFSNRYPGRKVPFVLSAFSERYKSENIRRRRLAFLSTNSEHCVAANQRLRQSESTYFSNHCETQRSL